MTKQQLLHLITQLQDDTYFWLLWTPIWIYARKISVQRMKDGTTITQCDKLMCTCNLNEEISSVINRETSAHTGQTVQRHTR